MSSNKDSYDVVIVGGGAAGLVLAARLSEDPNIQVAVLEAGDDMTADNRVNTPAMWPQMINSAADWAFRTVPQTGLGGREVEFPQGRLLGGSTSINSFIWAPTSKASADGWAQLGNPGWEWDSFEKHVRKACTLQTLSGETIGNGPIKLSIANDSNSEAKQTSWKSIWTDTWANLDFPVCDPFSGHVRGAVRTAESIDPAAKQRSGSAKAYLAPVRARTNLAVITGATVTKILLEGSPDDVVATGVQYLSGDGETKVVSARREVVISAGTMNSPRILELSGIGNSALLQSLGIQTIIDNPSVGENLQNHVVAGMSFRLRDDVNHPETLDPLFRRDPAAVAAAMEAYGKQQGPFASGGHWTSAQIPLPDKDIGELDLQGLDSEIKKSQVEGKAFDVAHKSFVRDTLSNSEEASVTYITLAAYAPFDPKEDRKVRPPGNYFAVAAVLAHPLSRGSVHITSSDPKEAGTNKGLAIDPKHLEHPLDAEVLARHLRYLEDTLMKTEPMGSLLKPRDTKDGFSDLQAAREYVRRTATGAHHYSSSCIMAPREMGGVVDAKLLVHGTRNLRVCDASIIPFTPRANPQASVYGIGELGASIIKESLSAKQ